MKIDKKKYVEAYKKTVTETPGYVPNSLGEYEDGSEEWLRCREHGKDYNNPMSPDYIPVCIGGSTIAKILGVSPWGSKLETFYEKSGIKSVKYPKEKNEAKLNIGHEAEEFVALSFQRVMNEEKVTVDYVENDINMYQHPFCAFALANVDRRISVNGVPGILECKTTSDWNSIKKYWQKGICPPYYEYQCRWYMAIMNLSYCYITCTWGFSPSDVSVILIKRDYDIEALMMAEAYEFCECCELGEEPSLENENLVELNKFYTRLYGEIEEDAPPVELPDTPEVATIIQDVQDIHERKAKKEAELEMIENEEAKIVAKLMKFTGGETTYASYRLNDDEVLGIKLKLPMKRAGFNEELLKEEDPDTYAKYLKTEEKFDVTKYKKENRLEANKYIIAPKVDPNKAVTLKEVTVRNIPIAIAK